MAIFLRDRKRKERECDSTLSTWHGTETVYLGNRNWAFSSEQPQTLFITCPAKPGETRAIPTIGVVELPKGCSAHTDDWVLQASLRRESVATPTQLRGPPTLKSIDMDFRHERIESSNETTTPFGSLIADRMARVMERHNNSKALLVLAGKTLQQLEFEDERRRENLQVDPRYPVEIALSATVALTVAAALAAILYRDRIRLNQLEERLRQHEAMAAEE